MKKFSDRSFANTYTQPLYGFLPKKLINVQNFNDDQKILRDRKIDNELLEFAVNSLTKFLITNSIQDSYKTTIYGIKFYAHNKNLTQEEYQNILNGLTLINGLNDQSIYTSLQLAQFDRYFRRSSSNYKSIKKLKVNPKTYANAKILINRNLEFLKLYAPVIKVNFDFVDAKTERIVHANTDILTRNAMIDLTLAKHPLDESERAYSLLHYVMLKHSPEATSLQFNVFGTFNALKNSFYYVEPNSINNKFYYRLEKVIGYKNPQK